MNYDNPRPLLRNRLEQLVDGLRIRLSSSSQQMAAELEQLRESIQQLEVQHEQDLKQLELSGMQQTESVTTEWDEELNSCWDDAELRTFKAVFETRHREKTIITTARSDSEQVNFEGKNRVNEIEKRHAHAIETLGHRLDQYRVQIDTVRRMIDKLNIDAEAALAKHSLRVPGKSESYTPESSRDSAQALDQSKVAIVAAQKQVRRLENLPMSKLGSSIWWWLICLAMLALGVAIPALLGYELLVSVPVGVGVLVLTILTAIIGVRPWLKKGAAAEYPKLRGLLDLAEKYLKAGNELSITENDQEQKRLGSKRDERLNSLTAWHETQIAEIRQKAESSIATLRAKALEEKRTAAGRLENGTLQSNREFQSRLDKAQLQSFANRQSAIGRLDEQRKAIQAQMDELCRGGAHRLQVSTQKAIRLIERNSQWCEQYFPAWKALEDPQANWPNLADNPQLSIGKLDVNSFVGTGAENQLTTDALQAEVLFSPLNDGYLVIQADPTSTAVKELIRGMLVRALTTLPAGKTQLCVIDPPGLGRDFGWLMHLGDFDPTLVSHRVWTQPTHIARQMQNLASAAEDFIQQSLRNQYANIVEYNREAGSLSEPYRLLVWSSMPAGLDDRSLEEPSELVGHGSSMWHHPHSDNRPCSTNG